MSDVENDDSDGEELFIDAAALLGLGEADPIPISTSSMLPDIGEGSQEGSGTNTPTMMTSQSEPILQKTGGASLLEVGSTALKRKESVVGEMMFGDTKKKGRNQRRSLGKRSLTLSGKQRSAGEFALV